MKYMNNKLTTPKSILIGSLMIAGSILYSNGFNFSIIPEVKAKVAGMDSRDLRKDPDFRSAVGSVVNQCLVQHLGSLDSLTIWCLD